ncbi:MAG: hypothetical protein ACRC10_12485 [Thermoguttaceae bacterium]
MSTVTETLAPVEIWEVMLDDATIKFFEPLVLQPVREHDDEEDEPSETEYLSVRLPKLNIDVFAASHSELVDWVKSDIRKMWEHFVRQDDAKLSNSALILKRNYLAVAEEVSNG